MSDKDTTIFDLKLLTRKFVYERNWDKYHNAKNLAATAITEAAELLELFRFKTEMQVDAMFNDPEKRQAITDELADTVWAIMRLADRYDIDFATEAKRKGKKSEAKYPAEQYRAPVIEKCAWLHIEERKVLGARSQGKEAYYLPGGKREGLEHDKETLMREVKEELSVELKPDTIKYLGHFEAQAHAKPAGTTVLMKCYFADYTGKLQPAAEVEELGWLTSADISTAKTSPVDKKILQYLHEQALID